MNSQRRNHSNMSRRVEDLEDRVTPSALGAPGAWQLTMRAVANAPSDIQRIARPSSFQYAQSPARDLGSGVTSWQGGGQTSVARFPAYLAQRVNPTIQPTSNVVGPRAYLNVGAATMRTNPPTSPNTAITPTTPETPPTTPTTADETPPAPLPPNVAGALNTLYQDYTSFIVEHPEGSYSPPPNLGFRIVNGQVGVNINGNGQGDFPSFVSSLQDLGMNVSATNAVTWAVSGLLPIGELAAVANNPQTLSVAPQYPPITAGGGPRL